MRICIAALFLASCFVTNSVCSQTTTFHRTYNLNGPSVDVFYEVATPDSGLVVLGMYKDLPNQYTLLFKINKLGDLMWSRNIATAPNLLDCRALLRCNDGGYMIGGTEVLQSSMNSMNSIVLKTDSAGNIQWSKYYGAGWAIKNIIQTYDNGFLLSGVNPGPLFPGIAVYKTDFNGNPEWGRVMQGNGGNGYEKISAVQSPDSTYNILYTSGIQQGPNLLLNKLSPLGNVIFTKYYVFQQDASTAIIATNDNNLLLVGITRTWSGIQDENLLAIKIDNLGDIIWTRTYGGFGYDYCSSAFMTPDNGFVFMGTSNSFPVFAGQQHDVYVFKTDSSGNVQWSKTYGLYDDSDATICGAVCTDNGLFIMGYLSSFTTSSTDIFILKTGPAGSNACNEQSVLTLESIPTIQSYNISDTGSTVNASQLAICIADSCTVIPLLNCYNPILSSITEMENPDLICYPNPVSDAISITIPKNYPIATILIYSYDGRVLKKVKPTGIKTVVDVSDLEQGFYILNIDTPGQNSSEKIQIIR